MSSVVPAQSYPIESLARELARKQALEHAKLLAAQSCFELPRSPFPGEDLLQEALQNTSGSLGLFAAKSEWFEPVHFESWLQARNFRSQLAYPRLEENGSKNTRMVFRLCRSQDLKPHPRLKGLWEAPEEAPLTEPTLVFAPCTLADKTGHRMGRGLGSYDRYFHQHPRVQRIGVLHNDFLLQSFPESWVQEHDQDLHALLTSNEFFKTTKEITS